jgi:hypothetical protein
MFWLVLSEDEDWEKSRGIMELLVSIFTNVTFLLLLGSLVVFGILAAQQKRIKSFQFQMSIVLLVLIVSEVIDVLFDFNYIENPPLENLGSIIHVISMAGIALIFWGRLVYSKKAQKSLVDEIQK